MKQRFIKYHIKNHFGGITEKYHHHLLRYFLYIETEEPLRVISKFCGVHNSTINASVKTVNELSETYEDVRQDINNIYKRIKHLSNGIN